MTHRSFSPTPSHRACWSLTLVIGVALLAGSLLPDRLQAARGGKTEVLPVQKAAPAVTTVEATGSEAELRRQLRVKNGVIEMTAATPAVRFSEAPIGSYGFIAPGNLGMALVTQSQDVMLDRTPPGPNAFELHKLADGSALLVGFVSHDLLSQVTPSRRPKNMRIALFSNPSDIAPRIVAVPLIKLVSDRLPTRVDPKKADSPVLFDMDLQSSVVRQSAQGAP